MTFVDTGAWFATAVPSDEDHGPALGWLRRHQGRLIRTDYVIDETLTLLRARGDSKRAFTLGEAFFSGSLATVYYLTEEDVLHAWDVFRTYTDKEWSFTDCTSKVVIEKFGLLEAFAFDHHFRQFGSIQVVP